MFSNLLAFRVVGRIPVKGVGVIKRSECPGGFGNRVSRRLGNRNSDWELFKLWICRQWYLALLQQFPCPLPTRACVVLMPNTRGFLLVGSTLTRGLQGFELVCGGVNVVAGGLTLNPDQAGSGL